MLIPNHPHDERLSALASRETDATADAALTAHVAACVRCTGLVDELASLHAVLADLPDLAPPRPLRLLPPVEPAPAAAADRLGGWARRFFAPVLASGAALALVGTIGTAAPALQGQSAGSAESGASAEQRVTLQAEEPQTSAAVDAEPSEAAAGAPAAEAAPSAVTGDTLALGSPLPTDVAAAPGVNDYTGESTFDSGTDEDRSSDAFATERSPWPMVLFTGVALMVGALLLRWILVPRSV
jgi:hypothetical protein